MREGAADEPGPEERAEIERRIAEARERKRRLAEAGHPDAADGAAVEHIEAKAKQRTKAKEDTMSAATINGHARRFNLGEIETLKASAAGTEGDAPKPKACPKCGGPLKGAHGTTCYSCRKPAKPKRPAGQRDEDDGFPKARKVGPNDPPPGIPAEDREKLAELAPGLMKSEYLVVTYRLGLDGNGRRSQSQTGKLIGKSATWVGDQEKRAVARLLSRKLDIRPYLNPRPIEDDEQSGILPLPEGFTTKRGKDKPKLAAAPTPPPAPAASDDEASARRTVLRALLDLDPDAAGRVLTVAADALGITLR